jgi:hypothetical protein
LWAQLLQSGKKDAALVARGIDAIANSARSQAMLIDDLLDVSRIVSGTLQVTLKPVALGPVIAEALEQIQRQADEKGVVLEVGVDPDVGEIAADADRLRQIVWNLASNAVKFTPAGGRVWISAAPCSISPSASRICGSRKNCASNPSTIKLVSTHARRRGQILPALVRRASAPRHSSVLASRPLAIFTPATGRQDGHRQTARRNTLSSAYRITPRQHPSTYLSIRFHPISRYAYQRKSPHLEQ